MFQVNICQIEITISVQGNKTVNEVHLPYLTLPEFVNLLINQHLFAQIRQKQPFSIENRQSGTLIYCCFQFSMCKATLSM